MSLLNPLLLGKASSVTDHSAVLGGDLSDESKQQKTFPDLINALQRLYKRLIQSKTRLDLFKTL